MTITLPEICYVKNDETGETVVVRAFVRGYFNAGPNSTVDSDELNARINVTKAQAAAMKVGSMFGFNVPGANPSRYDDQGRPK